MRYLEKYIIADLQKKMVFLGGPRQVGKTTLAKRILKNHFPGGRYLNWDSDEDREAILEKKWKKDTELLIFDELHKFPRWKNWIKGLYDTKPEKQKILVTGSARMDIYRKGGDSLVGRYHYWRLHPFTLNELPAEMSEEEAYGRLLIHGGFPEPFFENDERETRRWRKERFDHILREDIRDLEAIHSIQLLSLYVNALRKRTGSSIVMSNLARDLEISPKTAKSWLSLIEKMYLAFSVRPYSSKETPRAITKPPKVFFYDNGDVTGDEGARFENFVASHLLKRLNFFEDSQGYNYGLHYLRDKEGREVDFVITRDDQVEELIEVKLNSEKPARGLIYYTEKLKPKKSTLLISNVREPYDRKDIRVTSPLHYFAD